MTQKSTLAEVSAEEYAAALTETEVRATQVIHAALALGVVTFSLVAVGLSFRPTSGVAPAGDALGALTLAVLAATASALGMSTVVFGALFSPARLRAAFEPENPAARCVRHVRMALIVRLAIFEGAALFGIVVFLLAGLGGALGGRPWLWINLAPAAILVALVISTFPNRESLQRLFTERIRQS